MNKSSTFTVIAIVIAALIIHFANIALPASIALIIGGAIAITIPLLFKESSSSSEAPADTLTLYVGNLPYRSHEGEVRELFAAYGSVQTVRLVRDRKTGRRKGFGFVEMSAKDANKAMNALNDFEYQERTLKVREAKSQESES